MKLSQSQMRVKEKVEQLATIFNIDPLWASAVAMTESSLGMFQKSPTNCLGIFQMSSIAMKDLLLSMENKEDDLIDIACGVSFLYLLLKRHKTIEEATSHFCDPDDRDFYIKRVIDYMSEFRKEKSNELV